MDRRRVEARDAGQHPTGYGMPPPAPPPEIARDPGVSSAVEKPCGREEHTRGVGGRGGGRAGLHRWSLAGHLSDQQCLVCDLTG